MKDESCWIAGELAEWPTKEGLAEILRAAGLTVYVGRYSIRIENCYHFTFQEYGGDLGDPCIDADASSLEEMMRDGALVSNVLAQANIRHRFEIYDVDQNLLGYLHHLWPKDW